MALIIFSLLLAGSVPAWAAGGGWQYPAIKDYGGIKPLPDAVNQPSTDARHKAVFDVTKAAKSPDQPNPGLEHVARAVNVFASAGVPVDKLDFVAVVHGPATPSILNDAQYQEQFGQANPNTALIAALRKAGVTVHVCGQALAEHAFDQSWVDDDVDVALSALSDLVIYGERGYALVPQ
ncbi:hypothetical protein T31B1_12654 [Salinisphaera sp. T31B1]